MNKWSYQYSTKNMEIKKKSPIYTSIKRDDATSKNFRNTSISGFMKYRHEILWTEWQFLDESSAKWKEWDDKKYKPRSALKTLMRGPKFATPMQCYRLLNERTSIQSLNSLWYWNINDMILDMVNDNFLFPYVSGDGNTLLFTCNWKKVLFEKKFPKMTPCDKKNPFYQKMIDYINSLGNK